jgi:hypothetical protein
MECVSEAGKDFASSVSIWIGRQEAMKDLLLRLGRNKYTYVYRGMRKLDTQTKERIKNMLQKALENSADNGRLFEQLAPLLRELLKDDRIEGELNELAKAEEEIAKKLWLMFGKALQE